MGWVFLKAHESFDRYRVLWDELNRARGNHILLDSTFVGSLIRYFASSEALLGVAENGRHLGMVLLDRPHRGFWRTFQPSQAPLGLILLKAEDAVGQIKELIYHLPGWALAFSVTQQDPDFTVFRDLCTFQSVETLEYIATSRIIINGSFDKYWNERGRYYVDDLRRQTRRLEEQKIEMEFAVERDPCRMRERLSEYGRLEGVGWKGEEGTAVAADNRQGLFYGDILEKFARQDEAVVYSLLFNGKTVASDLCLRRDGMLVVLKIAYDETFHRFSPGKFIHREILRRLFEDGKMQTLEWYGRIHDWQQKLGSVPRTMFHINFHRKEWVSTARWLIKTARGVVNRRVD